MSGCAGGQLDQDESLRRNGDGECAIRKCKVLWRKRSAGCTQLRNLAAGWEGRTAHGIKRLDDVSVICVQTPDLHRGIEGGAGEFHGERF